jgi:hypothetical protein
MESCPECGADWSGGSTCTDHFHLMSFWELDHRLYEVHHLMVLCYHLQHPHLYSPEGLQGAQQLLVAFLEEGLSPQQVRQRMSKAVDSGTRLYQIKGNPTAYGAYAHPEQWTMTPAGMDAYYEQVRAWADSVLKSLRGSNN